MSRNNWRLSIRALLALILIAGAAPALALPDDREQNFQLEADQQTFDQKNGRVTYTGSARLQQGSLIIRAQEIVVQFAPDNSVQKVTASGEPAHFQQQPSIDRGIVSAQATQITYDSQANTVALQGQAKLEQDGATMRGHSIRYDINRELVSAESDADGGERIEMTIPPALIEQ